MKEKIEKQKFVSPIFNNSADIHRELSIDEIYDNLRSQHSLLKDIIYMDNYDKLTNEQKNAIEALSSVMYMTEHYFVDF